MPQSRSAIHPLALALALLGSGAAWAQDMPDEPAALLAQLETDRMFVFGDGLDFAAGELGAERVVKGAPYCADAVHEAVQWLPDGAGGAPNRIVRQQSTRLCRDGEGRTRQEVERGGRKLVYLRDPVARESWVLDIDRKTARRLGDTRVSGMDHAAWREYGERVREFARSTAERARSGMGAVPPVPAVPLVPPVPVLISPPEAGAAGQRELEVRVLRGQHGAEAAEWALPPVAVQWRSMALAPRGAGSVTPLPAKDVEGLRANGERTSWVIEAGKVGNDKPIQITREVWTSPELMVTMASRDFDPRSGENNYRLKNLKRGEPDAALMRVPADFAKPVRPSPRASGPTG